MSKVEIKWSKDRLSGDVAAQADYVGPNGIPMSVAMRLNAEAMRKGHLAHRFVPYITKMGNGSLAVKWSKDPASGDLVGQVTFTGPDGKAQTLSARANEAAIKAELVRRFAPQLQAVQAQRAVSGGFMDDITSTVSKAASSLAHGSVVKSIGKAVNTVMNRPASPAMLPADLASKLQLNPQLGRAAANKVLANVLGPTSSSLGPTVLKAMGNVMHGAQHGNPKAIAYVQQLAQKAAAGDPSANQLATLMNIIKQFPKPAAPVTRAPLALPAAPIAAVPKFSDYEHLLRSAISGFDVQGDIFAISGATPDVPGMGEALTSAVSVLFNNPIASSVLEAAAAAFFGGGGSAFNAIPSLLAVASRLMAQAKSNDPAAVAYVARAVEASQRGDEGAQHLVNVMRVLNEPAPETVVQAGTAAQPIPEAMPGVTTPAPSFEYLAAVQAQTAAAAGCGAGAPMNQAVSGHFQLDDTVQIPTIEFQQLLQAAGAKIAPDGVWGQRSVASTIEFIKRVEGEDTSPKALGAAITPYAGGKTLLVRKSLLENLVKLIQLGGFKGAASGADFVPGNMNAVEQYQIAGVAPDIINDVYTISGAAAPPSEGKNAEDVIAKAAKGDKEALAFMGLIKQRAAAKDQAAIRMQTLLTQAAHRLAAREKAAKAAVAKAAPKAADNIPTEGGPIAAAARGDAVVWSQEDPARGIAVSGLEAYVPPNEKDLRSSATMQYAIKVMDQSAAGNSKSRQLIDVLRARHVQGDVSASAMLWFLHQAWLMRNAKSKGATSGVSVAYGDNAWNPQPMNVKNYYQISGQNLGPFYDQPGYPLQGDVVAPDGRLLVIAGDDTSDTIAGANGKLMKKVWDGRKWTWQYADKALPMFAARPGFGMKDAMAAGRYAMQRRQLGA